MEVYICRKADPETNVVVERASGYLETSFLPGRSFADLADVNTPLTAWLVKPNARRGVRAVHALPHMLGRWGERSWHACPTLLRIDLPLHRLRTTDRSRGDPMPYRKAGRTGYVMKMKTKAKKGPKVRYAYKIMEGRREIERRRFMTKTEAEERMQVVVDEMAEADRRSVAVTVGDLVERWLEHKHSGVEKVLDDDTNRGRHLGLPPTYPSG